MTHHERMLAAMRGGEFVSFRDVYEPSAVVQLPDGRLLVLQDEDALPLVALAPGAGGMLVEQRDPLRLPTLADGSDLRLDDLEGSARRGDRSTTGKERHPWPASTSRRPFVAGSTSISS